MKNTVMKILGLVMVAGIMCACTTTSDGGASARFQANLQPFEHAWFDVYGKQCTTGLPSPGCNFFSDGSKITLSQDPYFGTQGAVTLSGGVNAGPTKLTYGSWNYVDSYGNAKNYQGFGLLNANNNMLYDANGNALNEMDSNDAPLDVIGDLAQREQTVQKRAGIAFAEEYSLSEDKGIMISKTLQDWAVMGRDRSRTLSDMKDISKRLYGLDADKTAGALTQAYLTRSQEPIEELNVDVAAHWATTPETSKRILKAWYKSEVAAYGIR